jgi:hypothetical protein
LVLALTDAAIGTLVTGFVGAIGIISAFFAPAWVQRKNDDRRDRRAFRKAKRLVGLELGQIAFGSDVFLDNPSSFGAGNYLLETIPITDWTAHKEVLSELAPDKVWEALPILYLRAEKLHALGQLTSPAPQLGPGVETFLKTLRDEARAAQAGLNSAEPVGG